MRVLCRWLLQVPTRHPGVALAIGRLHIPKETRVPAAVFLFLLVNVLVTVPLRMEPGAGASTPGAARELGEGGRGADRDAPRLVSGVRREGPTRRDIVKMTESADLQLPLSTASRRLAGVGLALALLGSGCTSVGPPILARDRFDYSSAVAESWKRQTLLNIVKLRYLDSPVFLDVAQIVSGYQLQTSVSAGGTASIAPSTVPTIGSFVNFGAQGNFIDRPTVTYVPLTGDQYVRGIVTPLRPEQVFSAILAGWPAETILFTAVARLNGLSNQRMGRPPPHVADPRFLRVVRLIGDLEESAAVGFRFTEGKPSGVRTIMFFTGGESTQVTRDQIDEVRRLLRLRPDATEFQLVFGPTAASDREIAVQTRSLAQILQEVGGQVEVPAEDVAQGRTWAGLSDPGAAEILHLMTIHSSQERSPLAFISVPYRDHWFWIDDRDLASKRNFTLLMLLFSLADTGEKKGLPLITIPAQ
jgi:hypothetical protein